MPTPTGRPVPLLHHRLPALKAHAEELTDVAVSRDLPSTPTPTTTRLPHTRRVRTRIQTKGHSRRKLHTQTVNHTGGDTISTADHTRSDWRRIIAFGATAGDCTLPGLIRYAQVSAAAAEHALQSAIDASLCDPDGQINAQSLQELLVLVTPDEQFQVHAAATRHLVQRGPDHYLEVVRHARAAGSALPMTELVQLLDNMGELSLSIGAYDVAAEVLGFADEVDLRGDFSASGRRLCSLAAAADGIGRVDTARLHLARAVSLGKFANDHALMARAAVRYALPTDWYSGDERAAGFLASVSEQPLETADHVAVTAARALAEMRVPLVETSGQQVAWVTRPGVAQPLASDALARSVGLPKEVRLLALLAWRSTHRSPEHLAQRREISEEAFNLAQRLRDPSFQVDAGVWAAVDAAEAGDRGAYDRAVALVRWIAERDGNPRLRWRALSLWAGQVMLDGDLNTAVTVRHEAAALAQDAHLPGWVASDMFIAGQLIITQDEPDGLRLMTALDNDPLLQNPIALAGVAYAHARVGDQAVAQRMVQRAFARLDAESSMLLTATRLAATVVVLKDQGLARRLVDLLTPYQDHWSVDSHGWWIDGPVHAWLAFLHNLLDQSRATQTHAHLAIETARVFRDERSLTRLSALDIQASAVPLRGQLTPRHVEVLTLVAQGHTNGEIAEKLSFSVSTIRQTLSELFDIFGTRNRSSLVHAAQTDGLLDQARR